jgi:hypothetical protein
LRRRAQMTNAASFFRLIGDHIGRELEKHFQ